MQGCNHAGICPYFDSNDERCGERFNLQRMREVFDQCLGEYSDCPIYHQLTISAGARDDSNILAKVG
jgi:hypothetical protein